MSDGSMRNIQPEEERTQGTTDISDEDNKGLSSLINITIVLFSIGMLAGFTILKYIIIIILIIKLVEMINNKFTINNNRTNNSSSSVQVCMTCMNRLENNTTSDSLLTTNDPIATSIQESQAQSDNHSEQSDTMVAETKRQTSTDPLVRQPETSSTLADDIRQLRENEVNHIDNLIENNDTVAVLITPTDEHSTSPVETAPSTTDTTLSQSSTTAPTTIEPIVPRSAFVTDNVMKVVVSYSGKQRRRVLKITRILQNQMKTAECPHPVFFDQDFQHEICRLNGQNHLLSIYRQAQLVIVFLSPTYTDSRYCYGEWRTIADRFLTNPKNKEATQLLLIKLGEYDRQALNLVSNDFAVNAMRRTNEEIAKIIYERWKIVEKALEQNTQ